MRRFGIGGTVALLAAALFVSQAYGQVTTAPNAALVYWRAFSVMPDMTAAEEDALTSMAPPVGADADALAARWETALLLLHDGAAIRDCDWGVDFKKEGANAAHAHGKRA